jgi:DNA processing protein
MNDDLVYKVAITLIPGIGDVHGKKLVSYCGGVAAVFREKKQSLLKIPGVGEALASGILKKDYLVKAEKEVKFMQRYRVVPLFYLDEGYPARLRHCEDGPMMLYVMGKRLPERPQVLSVVGTRRPTAYGQEMVVQIVTGMADLDILIVSGLAYGIDTAAHRASLAAGLPTAAVLAHGLDNLYPFVNKPLAEKIMENGCLVTEFPSGTKLNKDYFPRRNRVIAGLSDATLVVESAEKGGALITAEIALSYNRDVFTLPGRVGDPKSSGCNRLIKNNKAALVEGSADIRQQMNWDRFNSRPAIQHGLFNEFTDDEKKIWDILAAKGEADIDTIYLNSGFSASKVAALLLKLEFDGMIVCFPGKRYKALQ